MPWAKFDDKTIRSRKVRRVARKSPQAALLWMFAVVDCCERGTNEIHADALYGLLGHTESHLDLLDSEGLLVLVGDHYVVGGHRHLWKPAWGFGHRKRRDPNSRRRAHIPLALRLHIYERDGYRCLECGSLEDLTLDHIIPWSLGGPDTEENLRTLCRPCNSRKGARV